VILRGRNSDAKCRRSEAEGGQESCWRCGTESEKCMLEGPDALVGWSIPRNKLREGGMGMREEGERKRKSDRSESGRLEMPNQKGGQLRLLDKVSGQKE